MKKIFLDIGGANLKYISCKYDNNKRNIISSGNLPIFNTTLEQFQFELECNILKICNRCDYIYFTTTAPLLYASLKIGSMELIKLIRRSVSIPNERIYGYCKSGEFKNINNIKSEDILGCYNWCITRELIKKKFKKDCLIIDCGSSSTDIIPVNTTNINYLPYERMIHQELLYIGMRRTLVQTIVNSIPINEVNVRVIGEGTTTIGDVNYILGYISDNEYNKGKNIKTKRSMLKEAKFNITRLICADLSQISDEQIFEICEYICKEVYNAIQLGIQHVVEKNNISSDCNIILCGKENFFIEKVALKNLSNKFIYLDDILELEKVDYTPAIGMMFLTEILD